MARRIIVDGIRVEGEAAERIVDEVMRDVDASGAPRRIVPLSLLLMVAVACGTVAGLVGYLLGRFAGGIALGWRIAVGIVVSMLVAGVCSRAHWRFHRRRLRMAMRRHGFDLCSKCGYWLKGLGANEGRCPECGESRALREHPSG